MRLRQVALVASDLAKVSADIEAVLGLANPHDDVGVHKYGLVNAVWPVGDTFLEVVSPNAEGTTAGRLIERRGGDGGYMAIFQTDDIEKARARFADLGIRIVGQADREGVHMTHLHPKDTGGAIISVDAMVPTERWEWGGPHWRDHVRTQVSTEIVGCEMQGDDPEAMAQRWAQVLALIAEPAAGGWRIATEGGELRFVHAKDGRGEGLGAFDVAVHDPASVHAAAKARGCIDADGNVVLSGTRVRLLPA
jgi:hypothetical protein